MKKKKKAAPLKSRVQARALRTPSKGTPTKRNTSSSPRPDGASSSARIAAAPCLIYRFIEIIPVQNHFRAVAARRRDFHQGRQHGHADLHANAALGRIVRNGLRMIARRRGDHAASALVIGHQQDTIQRAAFLERSRHVKILHLQVQRVVRVA